MKGQLQGMLYGVGGYKDRDKYLKRAFEVTCAMENLVMEILTVSRMKSSGFSLQPGSYPADRFCRRYSGQPRGIAE
ncbi:MAG: hypothetical protein ACLTCQ_28150 [Enterocloster bolteae]